ncbi:MAG: hypothetical protein HWD59_03425 [Coxiellaceae bacterium]|nr:MAG: hypothetical protein HWD59_03425 [Coxiellaceae bacterium]
MAVNDIKTAKLVTEDRVLAAATAPQKINWSVLYMNQHLHAAEDGWRKLIRNPLTTLMTVIVIAVALALPAAMLVLLENVKALSAQWHNNTDIALYLQLNLPDDQARNLLRQLEQRPEIAKAKYISPSQGWQELQQQISMPNLMDSLKENPLPGVIIVTPKAKTLPQAACKH